jgi:hypothetical protein
MAGVVFGRTSVIDNLADSNIPRRLYKVFVDA